MPIKQLNWNYLLDVICYMARRWLRPGKKDFLLFVQISQGVMTSQNFCPFVSHSSIPLCVTLCNSVWAYVCVSTFLLLSSKYSSLVISLISSVCLHVLHALLIVIKEYSLIREMPSLLYHDVRSKIHQQIAVKMSSHKWCMTLMFKTCHFKETSPHHYKCRCSGESGINHWLYFPIR